MRGVPVLLGVAGIASKLDELADIFVVSVLTFELVNELECLSIIEVDSTLIVVAGYTAEEHELTWRHDRRYYDVSGQEGL